MQMANNTSKSPRKSFVEIVNTNSRSKRVLQRNREGLDRFFRNNSTFLSEANKSVYRLCKEITKENDFIITPQLLHGIRTGQKQVCSTYIVYTVADYWGLDGAEMMVKEFEHLPKVA